MRTGARPNSIFKKLLRAPLLFSECWFIFQVLILSRIFKNRNSNKNINGGNKINPNFGDSINAVCL
jgi:CRISPR/Cas system-associated protein endoribonuclease Cas2